MGAVELSQEPSPELLKCAFGSFATGVAVIGARGRDGEMVGMTVNSLTSVSMNPPLVLFCPSRSLVAFKVYAAVQHFTVSILPKHCEAISNHFARSGINKWQAVQYRLGACGAPYLDRALAAMECEVVDRHQAGDHLIVLGRVLRLKVSALDEPLVFFRSRYRSLDPRSETSGRENSAPVDVWG